MAPTLTIKNQKITACNFTCRYILLPQLLPLGKNITRLKAEYHFHLGENITCPKGQISLARVVRISLCR